jgi:arsenate reductase-like glutaredoxin family protein
MVSMAGGFLYSTFVPASTFYTKPTCTTCRNANGFDLMLENRNLIKRPVLMVSAHAIFGFDKKAYAAAGIR